MSPTGHLAVGFAVKRYTPKIPLAVLLLVPYALDLVYFVFLGVGLESIDYSPWSHSLLMAACWSVLAVLITLLISRKLKNAAVIGLLVFSHWLLDFIVWNDMLVTFDKGLRTGLGLYNAVGFSKTNMFAVNSAMFISSVIELGMLAVGVTMYVLYMRRVKKEQKTLSA